MHSNDTIQNELKELNSILAGISNRNVYTVPEGYFDVLSHDILQGIREQTSAIADSSTVPAGYFDGLADSIMGKIKAGAVADEGSSLLVGIQNINVYQVPEGYFDNLAANILSKLHQPAKVVVMRARSTFFRYAAAAVITGIMGLSVISVFDKKPTDRFASTAKDLDKEFASITDAEIVSYLQKDGQDINAALVASIADDQNLPEQVDYLTDDKTLDNLLDELKVVESTNN